MADRHRVLFAGERGQHRPVAQGGGPAPGEHELPRGCELRAPKLLELVKSLRVDMANCASVVAANTNRTKKSEVISIQAGG